MSRRVSEEGGRINPEIDEIIRMLRAVFLRYFDEHAYNRAPYVKITLLMHDHMRYVIVHIHCEGAAGAT